MSKKCIFCEMAKNKDLALSQRLYENEHSFVILALHQQIYGHTLVIPKKHYPSFSEVPPKMIGVLFQEVISTAEQLTCVLGAKAYVIKVNNMVYMVESHDTAHVGHIHFHILPRYHAEDVFAESPRKTSASSLQKIKERILWAK